MPFSDLTHNVGEDDKDTTFVWTNIVIPSEVTAHCQSYEIEYEGASASTSGVYQTLPAYFENLYATTTLTIAAEGGPFEVGDIQIKYRVKYLAYPSVVSDWSTNFFTVTITDTPMTCVS